MRAPDGYPSGKKGDVLTMEFAFLGIPCLGLNGSPAFRHAEVLSTRPCRMKRRYTTRLDSGGAVERVTIGTSQV
jgi:2-polyprenyl-6-hydroxyphenyl methylase/3-demethylubiquinone-9 3-methyltransferase